MRNHMIDFDQSHARILDSEERLLYQQHASKASNFKQKWELLTFSFYI